MTGLNQSSSHSCMILFFFERADSCRSRFVGFVGIPHHGHPNTESWSTHLREYNDPKSGRSGFEYFEEGSRNIPHPSQVSVCMHVLLCSAWFVPIVLCYWTNFVVVHFCCRLQVDSIVQSRFLNNLTHLLDDLLYGCEDWVDQYSHVTWCICLSYGCYSNAIIIFLHRGSLSWTIYTKQAWGSFLMEPFQLTLL